MVRHNGAKPHNPETTEKGLVLPNDTPTIHITANQTNTPLLQKTFARRDQLQRTKMKQVAHDDFAFLRPLE